MAPLLLRPLASDAAKLYVARGICSTGQNGPGAPRDQFALTLVSTRLLSLLWTEAGNVKNRRM
jgi:hypothetical protein